MIIDYLRADVAYANEVGGTTGSVLRYWLTSAGIRCTTWMRIASRPGVIGRIAKFHLLSSYGCDVGSGAQVGPGILLPHPNGIVIGMGVVIEARTHIYQGVTLGANSRGEYPVIESDVKLYPGAMVTGRVRVGAGARIGAGAFVYDDVAPGVTVRGPRSDASGTV